MSGKRTESREQGVESSALRDEVARLHAERGTLVIIARETRMANGIASLEFAEAWLNVERVTSYLMETETELAEAEAQSRAGRIYSERPCNHVVRCRETGEVIKDIKAELGLGKPARMPTLAAAEGAARWASEITGRTFIAEEVAHG